MPKRPSRRRFLEVAAAAPFAHLVQSRRWEGRTGRPEGTLAFLGEGRRAVGRRTGSGLGGRLAFDLKQLDDSSLVVDNSSFYIRTTRPTGFDMNTFRALKGRSKEGKTTRVELDDLFERVTDQGTHLLECAGNGRHRSFGLISSAQWSGVSISETLELLEMGNGKRLLVEGSDAHPNLAEGADPVASWVFKLDQLLNSGAFLATTMNGSPLPPDHGKPLRLIVPGWYGCCCVKWVQQLRWVDENHPATEQMLEYAGRTHQTGRPRLARDFQPACIDTAAMPVRVERRRLGGRPYYRVVGILWGGKRPAPLMIRFNPTESYVPVDRIKPGDVGAWSLWEHQWRPEARGRFRIELAVADESVRTRRLDRGYYQRWVEIDA